jgi:flagellar basal-body rod modification protein FlgD
MDAVSSIGNVGGGGATSPTGSSGADNPFLTLLIEQLRHQTPLEPVDNASFMEQVATFSSMEEQRELNESMLKLLDFQGLLARLQGLSEGSVLLGKEVTYTLDGDLTGKGEVDSVYINEDGEVRIVVGDDDISMGQVTAIGQAEESDV